jgi:hypothetical protein
VRAIIRIHPLGWALAGLWLWAPSVVFTWVWTGTQVRLGWKLATVEAAVTWGLLVAARLVSAVVYNRIVAPRHPFVFEGASGEIVGAPVSANVATVAVCAVPFAVFLGFNGNLWGWTLIIPDRWVVFPVLLLAAAAVYGAGSLVIYNAVVRVWQGTLRAEFSPGPGHDSLVYLAPRRIFRATAITTFVWFGIGIGGLWAVGGVLMVVLARHFPAGWFGLDVEIFVVSLAALAAYGIALIVGVWCALGAHLYFGRQRGANAWIWARTADEVMG